MEHPGLYTKVILTVIAIFLGVIACRPLLSPEVSVNAQTGLSGVQIAPDGNSGELLMFDTRAGELWRYHSGNGKPFDGNVSQKWKVTKLGQPWVLEYDERNDEHKYDKAR